MRIERTIEIKFKGAGLDVTVNEDGHVMDVVYERHNVNRLMFDLGHNDDIQTLTTEVIAEQEQEINEINVCDCFDIPCKDGYEVCVCGKCDGIFRI